jgi:hypothetical protein
MMPVVQINVILYQTEAGKNGVGNRQERGRKRMREGERERE